MINEYSISADACSDFQHLEAADGWQRKKKTKAIIPWQLLILDLDVSGLKEADLTIFLLFFFSYHSFSSFTLSNSLKSCHALKAGEKYVNTEL